MSPSTPGAGQVDVSLVHRARSVSSISDDGAGSPAPAATGLGL